MSLYPQTFSLQNLAVIPILFISLFSKLPFRVVITACLALRRGTTSYEDIPDYGALSYFRSRTGISVTRRRVATNDTETDVHTI